MSRSYRPALLGASLVGVATLGLSACGAGTSTGAAPVGSHPTTTAQMPMAGMPMAAPAAAPASPAIATNAVSISNFKFGPEAITVKVGASVTWTNTDDEAHTVFFSYDGSRSPILVNSANVYSKTFSTPGTFVYHCTIHPFMTGTVVVTA
jgi:plastocyanin